MNILGQNGVLSKKSIGILIVFIILFSIFAAVLFSPEIGHIEREHETANVVIFSKEKDTNLIKSLKIDSNAISLTVITEENFDEKWDEKNYDSMDVIIIDRFLPNDINDLRELISNVNGSQNNCGLIFFGAILNDKDKSDFNAQQTSLISPILPIKIESDTNTSTDDRAKGDYKIQVTLNEDIREEKQQNREDTNVLVRDIAWPSCPLISKRLMVKPKSNAKEIIESIDKEYSILAEWPLDNNGGQVITYSILVSGKSQEGGKYNEPFSLWPYFNYLIYVSVFHADQDFNDSNIESYAEWPFSPIPHLIEIILWFSMIGALWLVTIYWFLKMRKKKLPKINETKGTSNNVAENSTKKND